MLCGTGVGTLAAKALLGSVNTRAAAKIRGKSNSQCQIYEGY